MIITTALPEVEGATAIYRTTFWKIEVAWTSPIGGMLSSTPLRRPPSPLFGGEEHAAANGQNSDPQPSHLNLAPMGSPATTRDEVPASQSHRKPPWKQEP
jgi:hypothetical protein